MCRVVGTREGDESATEVCLSVCPLPLPTVLWSRAAHPRRHLRWRWGHKERTKLTTPGYLPPHWLHKVSTSTCTPHLTPHTTHHATPLTPHPFALYPPFTHHSSVHATPSRHIIPLTHHSPSLITPSPPLTHHTLSLQRRAPVPPPAREREREANRRQLTYIRIANSSYCYPITNNYP